MICSCVLYDIDFHALLANFYVFLIYCVIGLPVYSNTKFSPSTGQIIHNLLYVLQFVNVEEHHIAKIWKSCSCASEKFHGKLKITDGSLYIPAFCVLSAAAVRTSSATVPPPFWGGTCPKRSHYQTWWPVYHWR